jgi:hypothetical protein
MSIDWRILSQVGRLCGPAMAKADAQKLSQLSKNEIVVSEIEMTAIILTILNLKINLQLRVVSPQLVLFSELLK